MPAWPLSRRLRLASTVRPRQRGAVREVPLQRVRWQDSKFGDSAGASSAFVLPIEINVDSEAPLAALLSLVRAGKPAFGRQLSDARWRSPEDSTGRHSTEHLSVAYFEVSLDVRLLNI